jgi:hypothetical protein
MATCLAARLNAKPVGPTKQETHGITITREHYPNNR